MAVVAHHSMRDFHHPSVGSLVEAARTGFAAWRARAREREALALMNDRELHDIGLSRWDAQHEVDKPFWRQ